MKYKKIGYQSEQFQNINFDRIKYINPRTKEIISIKKNDRQNLNKAVKSGFIEFKEFTKNELSKQMEQYFKFKIPLFKNRLSDSTDISDLTSDGKIKVLDDSSHKITCLQIDNNKLLISNEDITNYKCLIAAIRRYPIAFGRIMSAEKHFIPKHSDFNNEEIMFKNMMFRLKEWMIEKTPNLKDDKKFKCSIVTRCAWIFQGLSDYKKCKIDGKPIGFQKNVKIAKPYGNYCCSKCRMSDPEMLKSIGDSIEKKYRCRSYAQTEAYRKKCNERYGVDYPFQSKEVKEKRRLAIKEKIKDNPSYYKDILKKRKESFKRHYGTDNNMKSVEGYMMWQKSIFKKYGVRHNWSAQAVKDQIKQTNLSVYGYEYASQSPDVKAKSISSCNELYGCDYYFQSDEFKSRLKKFNNENFGVDFTWQRKDVKQKSKDACMKKFGVETSSKSEQVRQKTRGTWLKNFGYSNPMKCPDIRRQSQSKYSYDNMHFDSAPELAYYIFLKDHCIKFKYQPDKVFSYVVNGKQHEYIPDFYLEDEKRYIELKGNHFFKEDGTMYCPFRNKDMSDEEYAQLNMIFEAKHQCMIQNRVKIILTESEEMKEVFRYIEKKYRKNYLKQFKN